MSSGTAAQPPDTAATPPESRAGGPPEGADGRRHAVPKQSSHDAGPVGPGRHLKHAKRPGRGWALLTAAAAVLFCVALVLGAMRLYTDVNDVTDTPERTVDAFLEALLDQRDASAASQWLCSDKADRDLSEAVSALSSLDGEGRFEWGEVAETGRSVAAATVTAEIRIGGGHDDTLSDPTTWVFSLVAEEGEPQWLICGIAAQ
ncbi:hypothetical protein [Glycomyces harbinensis]|uniref:Uncharacterized protein n=1 Tax=Glycomyces harbinensis TaxID=58114 RepID=A0A1G6YR62_9ACTN|nr:hypothetical protein [Glycomyces harbinensis]SDD92868.1 hypothetical protein SAMN05216270_109130 [Glycomyces harbinensis]